MITQVHARGTLVGAAIRRAYAPRDVDDPAPQLIAAWQGGTDLADLDPPVRPGGYDTSRLAALLAQPLKVGGNPPSRPVWRCTVELDPHERQLTAREWQVAVRQLLHEAGLAPQDDDQAVRWIAVAHGNTRIDLVATLVRQDGRIEHASDDRRRCQHATRNIERRFGLRPGPPGPTTRPPATHPAPSTPRTTPPSPRDRLRREVRAAAIVAVDEEDFLARLREGGLRVRLRQRSDGSVTGYAVSHGVTDADAVPPTWFAGSQLAPDLTLAHLRTRWAHQAEAADPPAPAPTTGAHQDRVWTETTEAVSTANTSAATQTPPATAAGVDAIADVLAATARTFTGPQRQTLEEASEQLRRAIAGSDRRRPAAPDSRAVHLRSLARLVGIMGQLSGDRNTAAALQIVYLIAGFADNLATFHQAQQQRAQAAAAASASAQLRTTAGAPPPTRRPASIPPVAPAGPARQRTHQRSR